MSDALQVSSPPAPREPGGGGAAGSRRVVTSGAGPGGRTATRSETPHHPVTVPRALRARTPAALPLAVVWLLTVNALQAMGLQGVATIGYVGFFALLAIFLLPLRARGQSAKVEPLNPEHYGLPVLLWVFLGYTVVWLLVRPDFNGLQNIVVYAAFFLTVAVTARQTSASTPKVWLPRMARAGVVASIVYCGTVAVFGLNNSAVYSARAFAMVGVVAVCAAIPIVGWKEGRLWYVGVIILAVGLSLSRMALGTAWALTLFLTLRRPTPAAVARAMAAVVLLGLAGVWAAQNIQPLRDRFESNDNVTVFGVGIGTTGRADIWAIVLRSWEDGSHWWGNGPGTAQTVVVRYFSSAIDHPHSEYLRVLHDYGWVGLGLLCLGMAHLLYRILRSWRRASNDVDRAAHQAALLAWIALALMSITSNITVFVFAMVPMGALIGMSLGRASYPSARGTAPEVPKQREAADAGR